MTKACNTTVSAAHYYQPGKKPEGYTAMRRTTSHIVNLPYEHQELLALFTQAVREDVEKGGRYDARSDVINVWSHPWVPQSRRAASTIMGTFHCMWEQDNTIYQIEADTGFSLNVLLQELCVLELKALGRVKHGKCHSLSLPLAGSGQHY
jgi:hypothetical protein